MYRKLPVILGFLLVWAGVCNAAYFGPAEAERKAKSMSLGFGYMHDYKNGGTFQQKQYLASLHYAATDNLTLILRGGMEEFQSENLLDLGLKNKGDYAPFVGAGAKLVAYRGPDFSLGLEVYGYALGNVETSRTIQYTPAGGSATNSKVTYQYENFREFQAAILLQTVVDGGILYAGPYYRYVTGDLAVTFNAPLPAGVFTAYPAGTAGAKLDFVEKRNLGGIAGLRWPLKNGVNVDFEVIVNDKVGGGVAVMLPIDF